MMPDAARRRIEALAASSDPLDKEVARRLAGRLPANRQASSTPSDETSRPASKWAHVDLVDLLAYLGNPVKAIGERLKSAHEPVHGSRSRACLVAWPTTGRWWCASCGRSGDAVTLAMQALGVRYPAAVEWLTARYGAPANAKPELSRWRGARRKRQSYNVNVRRVVLGGESGA